MLVEPPPPPNLLTTLVDNICLDFGDCGGGGLDVDEMEEDILITFESQTAKVTEQVRQATVRAKTKEQLGKRFVKVGNVHGKWNPLPASFRYPKSMTLTQLTTLWHMGNPRDGVPPLKICDSKNVGHFDKNGSILSRMKRLMEAVKLLAVPRGLWKPRNVQGLTFWNGSTVTALWTGIWDDIKPYLLTKTKKGEVESFHKSRAGKLSWRTCHDKLYSTGLFKELGIVKRKK